MTSWYKKSFLLSVFLLSVCFSQGQKNSGTQSISDSRISFTQNKGQVVDMNQQPRPDILFTSGTVGTDVYLRKTGISYVLSNAAELMRKAKEQEEQSAKPQSTTLPAISSFDNELPKKPELLQKQKLNPDSYRGHRIDVDFEGANPNAEIQTRDQLEGVSNYYLGHCPQGITNVHSYGEVTVKNIYKHIDVRYFAGTEHSRSGGSEKGLEYDIIVNPGGNPNDIKLKYSGAEKLQIKNYKLQIKTSLGELGEYIPRVYQNINGKIVDVKARYVLTGTTLNFELETWNPSFPLVVDPWVTYYGGSGQGEYGNSVNTDKQGNIIFTGFTYSTNFPVSPGALQSWHAGGYTDGFVVKMNQAGGRVFATLFGGSGMDGTYGIDTDINNNIFVTGSTASPNMPVKNKGGAYMSAYNAGSNQYATDVFVAEFDPNGGLIWSTFMGGTDSDSGADISLDAADNVYICGRTYSTDFPVSAGAYQSVNKAVATASNGIVAKFNSAGALQWSTYYGGSGVGGWMPQGDSPAGIACDATGVYFGGWTFSTDFPLLAAFQTVPNGTLGGYDGFLVKLNPSNGFPIWSTYYDGITNAIDVDNTGNIVITGATGLNNLATGGVYQSTGHSGYNVFVSKFTNGGNLLWCTYIGGSANSQGYGIAVDGKNNIVVGGITQDPDFPTTPCAYDPVFKRKYDYLQFLTTLDPSGKKLLCSTFICADMGDDWTAGGCVAVYGCFAYIVGYAAGGYHVTPNAYQPNHAAGGNNMNAVLAQLYVNSCTAIAPKTKLDFTGAPTTFCPGQSASFSALYTDSTGSCGTDTTGTKYLWTFPGGKPSASTAKNPGGIVYNNPGTYKVKLVVITCTKDSIEKAAYITVKSSLPTAAFSSNSVCLGIATEFTDLSTGAGTKTWLWDFGDGTTSTEQNPQHVFSTGGTHTVKLTVKGGCGTATITKTVTVNSTPGPKIICPSTVCPGASAPYSTDAICTSYNWSVTGGTIVSGQNTNQLLVDWGAGPKGTITLSTSGCTPANCAMPTTVVIPILPVTAIIAGPVSVCQSDVNTYTLPAFPGSIYKWNVTPATTGTITTGQGSNHIDVQWSNPTDPNAQVSVSINNPFTGCKSTGNLPVKILTPFFTSGANTACKGSSSNFTASPTDSYTWTTSGGGVVTAGQGTAAATINWNTAGTYTVTATPTPGTYCNASSTIIVTVADVPAIDSISGQKNICPGSTYLYNAWSIATGTSFNWTVVNGTLSSSTTNPVSITWGATGPYSVSVTQTSSSPACSSAPFAMNVNVKQIPSPAITGALVACVNGTYTYSVPAIPGATYAWSVNPPTAGSVVSGQGSTTIQIQYNGAGAATVDLSIGSVCATGVNVSLAVFVNPAPIPTAIITGNLCPGSSVTLSSTGFQNYKWEDAGGSVISTTTSASAGAPGPYILTVTDANGCQGKTVVNVNPAPLPKAEISTPDKRDYCSTETISTRLYAMEGPGYTYQWYFNGNPAGTGSSLTATSVGSYSVVVTNPEGCTKASSVITITQKICIGGGVCVPVCDPTCAKSCPPPTEPVDFDGNKVHWGVKQKTGSPSKNPNDGISILSSDVNAGVNILATQIFCTNTINYTDQSPNPNSIQWYWDFGDGSSSTLQNPPHTYAVAGYYYLTFAALFSNGGFGITHKSIEIPVVGDFTDQVMACGTVAFTDLSTHTPGSPITSWTWDFGDGTTSSVQNPTHTYSAAGTYNVILTLTAGSCTTTFSKTVVIAPFPAAKFSAPASCSGTPTVFSEFSTGPAKFMYWSWDFGDAGTSSAQKPTHTYIAGGTYTVTLTVTDINGCTNSTTQSVVISPPAAPATITPSGPLTFCAGNSVTLTSSSAASYLWSTGSTAQSITVSQSGTYSLTTKNSGGCPAPPPSPVTVIVTPLPDATLTSSAGNVCSGDLFTAKAHYDPNYSYQWYDASGPIAGQISWAYSTPNAGSYHVVVTDVSSGCSVTSSPVTATSIPTPSQPAITGPGAFCEGSTVNLSASASGGTAPLTYSWSTGQTTSAITVSSAGDYTVNVTDKNGCKSSNSTTLTTNPLPDLSIFPTGCYTRCASDTNHMYGPAGYATYNWQFNGSTVSTAQDFTATKSGTYRLIVSTSFGCKDTSGDLNLNIVPVPIAKAGPDVTLCTGDSTHLSASGGIIYAWNPPTFLSDDSIANPYSKPNVTVNYELIVTDKNGCKDRDSVTVKVSCLQPVVKAIGTSVCPGACASITATGKSGTPPYTYSWSDGQTGAGPLTFCPTVTTTYTVTIFDKLGASDSDTVVVIVHPPMILTPSSNNITCNNSNNGSAAVTVAGGTPVFTYFWSPVGGTNSTTANILSPGTYTVIVTDANGCSTTTDATITEPPPLTAITASTAANCGGSDGSVSVLAAGGTPMYSYSWNNGASGSTVLGLAAGTFTVTVTDVNNCSVSTTAIISNAGNLSTDILSSTNTTCKGSNDGSATANPTGGTAPYAYTWSSGGTAQTESTLIAGTYTVTVNDTYNCAAITTVTITEPAAIILANTPVDAHCGQADGSASITAIGGSSPYTYSWPASGGSGSTVSGLVAGIYTVTVSDANGCSTTVTTFIKDISGPSLTTQSTDALCFGSSNGTAQVNATGGTGLYTYNWQPTGNSSASVSGLGAGTYTVNVIDAAGCLVSSSVTITEPVQINIAVNVSDGSCGVPNGSAVVITTGATGTLTYNWAPAGSGQTATGLSANTYSVTVSDANGCTSSTTALVGNSPPVTVTTTVTTTVSCNGSNDGTAIATVNGGTTPVSYTWLPSGAGSQTISGLSAGTYTVNIIDTKGCTAISNVTITQPNPISVLIPSASPICVGQSSILTATANGGTPAYLFSWMPGSQSGSNISVNPTTTTTYTVTATDAKGCISSTQTVVVTVKPPIQVVANANKPICSGASTTISATASGGDGNYKYTWLPMNSIGATQTVTPTGITTYTVVVSDGCGTIPVTATVTVQVVTPSTPVFTPDSAWGCVPLCVNFSNVTPGVLKSCSWNFGDGGTSQNCNPNYCYRKSGIYSVKLTVTDTNGCTASIIRTNNIKVFALPTADFTLDPHKTTILSPTINFTDHSSPDVVKWNWNFGDLFNSSSSKKNPAHTYQDTGRYDILLTVTNAYGCVDTATDHIIIEGDYTFYVPNAFTPNGDGKNETFFPKGVWINPECYHMMIFDRWGNLIWETDDLNEGWNGKANGGAEIAQQDVYVWKITTCDFYKHRYLYVGHVTLVK